MYLTLTMIQNRNFLMFLNKALLAVVPVVALNKTVQKVIPEADDAKRDLKF